MTKYITLRDGKVTAVSEEDFEYLSQWGWRYIQRDKSNYWYVGRNRRIDTGCGFQIVRMGRLVLERKLGRGLEKDELADHEDRDTLNNTRENIRSASHQGNSQNRGPKKNGSSRFKGVYWYKPRSKWMAKLNVDGKKYYLGLHKTEEEAARAFDEAAKKYHTDFRYLNFP